MTFHEMWLNTIRAAQNLQRRGFHSGQVFGFMSGNSDHLASLIFASFCLACPISPMHPALTKEEIIRILVKTKPSVIFCDASAVDHLNEALNEIKLNVKVFIFGDISDGSESVGSLFVETDDENQFV